MAPKTVVVYDENSLDSAITAACLKSFLPITVSECKSFPPEAEKYLWIGVVPTRHYFHDKKLMEKEHVCIAKLAGKTLSPDIIPNTNFCHSSDVNPGFDLDVVFAYGDRTLLERSLIYFEEDVNKFVGVIDMVKSFLEPKTSLEQLYITALNMKEALLCLETGEPYSFISYSPAFVEAAQEAYEELDAIAKKALSHRCLMETVSPPKGDKFRIFTFFEHKHWWFIRRRFNSIKAECRNVSRSVTGTIITGRAVVINEYQELKPVFVL